MFHSILASAAVRRKMAQHSWADRAVWCDSTDPFLDDILTITGEVDGHQSGSQKTASESSLLEMNVINNFKLDNERLCKENKTLLTKITLLLD